MKKKLGFAAFLLGVCLQAQIPLIGADSPPHSEEENTSNVTPHAAKKNFLSILISGPTEAISSYLTPEELEFVYCLSRSIRRAFLGKSHREKIFHFSNNELRYNLPDREIFERHFVDPQNVHHVALKQLYWLVYAQPLGSFFDLCSNISTLNLQGERFLTEGIRGLLHELTNRGHLKNVILTAHTSFLNAEAAPTTPWLSITSIHCDGMLWSTLDSPRLENLAMFPNLTALDLKNPIFMSTQYFEERFRPLGLLIHLTDLNVGGMPLHDEDIVSLVPLKKLNRLNLRRTKIRDPDWRLLSDLNHLQSLDLSETDLKTSSLKKLALLSTLTALNLSNVTLQNFGDIDHPVLLVQLNQFPQLTSLDLSHNNWLLDTYLSFLTSTHLPHLTDLILSGCTKITAQGVTQLLSAFNLQSLRITHSESLNITTLQNLQEQFPNVRINR